MLKQKWMTFNITKHYMFTTLSMYSYDRQRKSGKSDFAVSALMVK